MWTKLRLSRIVIGRVNDSNPEYDLPSLLNSNHQVISNEDGHNPLNSNHQVISEEDGHNHLIS